MLDFGELLKALRQNAKLTQQQLADRMYVSKHMVSYYENSRRHPSADILIQIADVFHVSVDYLLGREKKEQILNVNGLPAKDIEFVQSVVTFLLLKNNEQNQKNNNTS